MLAAVNVTDWRKSSMIFQVSLPSASKYLSTKYGGSRISARFANTPARASATASVSMSEPTISMSYWSTSGQFSSSQMAIEYGSSPVEHGTDQILIWPPRAFAFSLAASRSDAQARELVLLAVEVRLVHRERVDELLDLAPQVDPETREIVFE